jgi:hypothetical protein
MIQRTLMRMFDIVLAGMFVNVLKITRLPIDLGNLQSGFNRLLPATDFARQNDFAKET